MKNSEEAEAFLDQEVVRSPVSSQSIQQQLQWWRLSSLFLLATTIILSVTTLISSLPHRSYEYGFATDLSPLPSPPTLCHVCMINTHLSSA